MSSKPISLLSFIYNTTGSPAYRTEMHVDMVDAFNRFRIEDKDTRTACFEIEKAAYELRIASSDAAARTPSSPTLYKQGLDNIQTSSRKLFHKLKEELVLMVQRERPPAVPLEREIDPTAQHRETVSGSGPVSLAGGQVQILEAPPFLVLDYVYYFFHFPDLRNEIVKARGVATALSKVAGASGDVLSALGRLAAAMNRTGSSDQVAGDVGVLCDCLALEYQDRGWRKCW
jgi:hypothetical protein